MHSFSGHGPIIKLPNELLWHWCSFCGRPATPLFTTSTGDKYICSFCVRTITEQFEKEKEDAFLTSDPSGE